MRFLFCCELYYPSVAGVPVVMRELAERLVRRGHEVTIATTRLRNRTFDVLNGVKIVEFSVSGNGASGMKGEIDRYRDFVLGSDVDAVLIKAAQQWTFDALWPVVDEIRARKVFIPCGFSGLYQSSYAEYFRKLPAVLNLFDHLILYASNYRDMEYMCKFKISHYSIIPNGASPEEFEVPKDPSFRKRYGISEESFVFLTVGGLTGMKGHLEVARAFARLNTNGRSSVLILNGNIPTAPQTVPPGVVNTDEASPDRSNNGRRIRAAASQLAAILSARGWKGLIEVVAGIIDRRMGLKCIPERLSRPVQYWVGRGNLQKPLKKVMLVDLPRDELIQSYKNSDLFVFASNIEYSPLVLFESAAAGLPFLSVPVGNAEEIARWTGGGIICPANIDAKGYTRVSTRALTSEMARAMNSPSLLKKLGEIGHDRWRDRFTWSKIVVDYENILAGKKANFEV